MKKVILQGREVKEKIHDMWDKKISDDKVEEAVEKLVVQTVVEEVRLSDINCWGIKEITKALEYIKDNTEGFLGYMLIHFEVNEIPKIIYRRKLNYEEKKENENNKTN